MIAGEVNGASVVFQHEERNIVCLLHEPEEKIIEDKLIMSI